MGEAFAKCPTLLENVDPVTLTNLNSGKEVALDKGELIKTLLTIYLFRKESRKFVQHILKRYLKNIKVTGEEDRKGVDILSIWGILNRTAKSKVFEKLYIFDRKFLCSAILKSVHVSEKRKEKMKALDDLAIVFGDVGIFHKISLFNWIHCYLTAERVHDKNDLSLLILQQFTKYLQYLLKNEVPTSVLLKDCQEGAQESEQLYVFDDENLIPKVALHIDQRVKVCDCKGQGYKLARFKWICQRISGVGYGLAVEYDDHKTDFVSIERVLPEDGERRGSTMPCTTSPCTSARRLLRETERASMM